MHSNASNLVRRARIWLESVSMLEYTFECFESCSNASNFHSNGLNLWLVQICIRMLQICIRMLSISLNSLNLHSIASNPFEWLEFTFEECLESRSKGLNLHSNALDPFRMVKFCIRILRISFKWFVLHSNGSNPFWMIRNCFQMLRISFGCFEFPFESLESL